MLPWTGPARRRRAGGVAARGPPVLVACEAPSCRVVWTVELAGAGAGTDRAAVWRAHSRHAPQASAGQRR
ncbi:MAG: hypothetical protein ACRDZ4_01085 [Egibacteraceae bacterium]